MRKIVLLFLFITTVLITGCQKKELQYSSIDYYQYFDTIINLQVWDTKTYDEDSKLWDGAEKLIKEIQDTFQRDPSDLFKEPELYRLNKTAGKNQPFKVSDKLYEVIKIALEFSEKTDGNLDPTVGPLVDLWDINKRAGGEYAPPTQAEIEALLPLVDYKLVQVNDTEKSILLPKPGMKLDFGAIAKGYAADKLAEFFTSKGIKSAIINLGGNIYALGDRHTKRLDGTYNWAIGIRDPKQCSECAIANVYLTNKTIVTSGIYERYFTDINDPSKVYHHILNPKTGYPYENEISSVTIITPSSAMADALSTSAFAFGIERGIDFLEKEYPDVQAIFLDKDLNVYKTAMVDELYKFELLNKE